MKMLLVIVFSCLVFGCTSTPKRLIETPKKAVPVPVKEAAWACKSSDMAEYTTANEDFILTIKCH